MVDIPTSQCPFFAGTSSKMGIVKRAFDEEPKTNPYVLNNEPLLLPSFVCYLDLLGWEGACRRAFATHTAESFITNIRAHIHETYQYLRELQPISHRPSRLFEVKTFTDNIVLAIPDDHPDLQAGTLISLLELTAALQLQMLSVGFPTRGGIAYGPHFMDDDFAFGNALLDAVQFDKSDQKRANRNNGVEDSNNIVATQ
jgi:hypothetical protein